jgi:hypothetical protein
VGVDVGGGVDLRVPEQVLDRHEFDALFEEEGRGRVAEVDKRMRRMPAISQRASRLRLGPPRSGL